MTNHHTSQLHTLLKLRRAVRDERRTELSGVRATEAAVQAAAAQTVALLADLQESTRRCVAPGATDVRELCEHRSYGQVLRARLAELRQRQEELQHHAAELQQALTIADREMRILEKLQERRDTQSQVDWRKAEQSRLDELAHQGDGKE